MATASRDARRRRIMERGSDRLALITGRIQTLPSSSELESESSHFHTASCTPSISHDHPPPPDLQTLFSLQSPVSTNSVDKPSVPLFPNHEPDTDSGQPNTPDSARTSKPLLRKCETSSGTIRAPTWEIDAGTQSSLPSSTIQNPPISASEREHSFPPQTHRRKVLTSKQITTAVAATENIRTYCSLAFAVLVVLSFIGFPILGSRVIKSIIIMRPLYLLLLTNISIVLALLLSEKQRGLGRADSEASNVPLINGYGLAENVGNALELGLVLQNIMGALFMDCSVYAIAVICGLSVAQKLGW